MEFALLTVRVFISCQFVTK